MPPLTQAHKADLALLQTKSQALKSFLDENAEKHTPQTIASASTQRDELTAIKSRIDGHVAVSGIASEVEDFDTFLNAAAPGGLKHIGGSKTGVTEVDHGSGVVHNIGAGVFGAKTWDAMKDPHYTKAFGEYLKRGERMSAGAYKVLEVGADPQGGFLAPTEQLARMIERQPTPTRLAGMVEQLPVGRDAVEMLRVNYQGNNTDDINGQIYSTGFRVSLTEELPTPTSLPNVNDANIFGKLRIDNYTHMMQGALTNSQIEDPAFDVMGWYEGKFHQTVDIFRDDMIANGPGVQASTGILPYAANANAAIPIPVITTATSGQISGDDLFDLVLDISEQYDEDIRYVMNKTQTYRLIRKLKDSSQRYIFGTGNQDNGLANGKPTDLCGYAYLFTALMRQRYATGTKAFASGTTPIIAGSLKGYTQTLRLGFSIQVCRELNVLKNQVLFVGRLRLGGTVTEPWRLRVLQVQ